jgi:hypothetical protein
VQTFVALPETHTANRWGTTNIKTTCTNQRALVRSYLLHSSLAGAKCKPLLLSLELTVQIGRRLLIANHLEPSERGSSSSQIVFVTLFSSRYKALVRLLPASAQCADMLGQNHFAEPNWHVLTSLHPILMSSVTEHCWGFL